MKIGVLNSGGYNLNSIVFALNRIGINDIIVVKTPEEFDICDKIILPGVGHAKNAMDLLRFQDLIGLLQRTNKHVLGICLGMQIMFSFSQEGNTDCTCIFPYDVIKLPANVVTPQMGWNKLFGGKYNGEFVYFANSYYVPFCDITESYVEYCGVKISAIVRRGNFFGCQFHPEKSAGIGSKILNDFILL